MVMEGSLWTFDKFHLIYKRLKAGDNPREIVLNKMDIWVQLHEMNPGFMDQRVVTDNGSYIGSFVESDQNSFIRVWRDYICVRVTITIDKPLKRRMKFKKSETNWCWVNFKYEDVPTFCFICGLIGHSKKYYERIFEVPKTQIERPYRSWMCAELKEGNHTMGSKWLRQGGSTHPLSSLVNAYKDYKEFVTKFNEDGEINSLKSGMPNDKYKATTQIMLNDNQGNKQQFSTVDINFKFDKAWKSLMHNGPGEDNDGLGAEDAGLIITNPERRKT